AVVWSLLHSNVGRRLGRRPETGRWQVAPTPLVGGIGIYVGLAGGIWLAVATGGIRADSHVLGVFAGASMLFIAGLADDVRALPPVVKLATQSAAAAVVLATGTRVEIFHSEWVAIPLGVVWLVGLT